MTKTIVALRTLHVAGKDYKPAEIDPITGGHRVAGNYAVKEVAPGNTVEIDEDEAEKLVASGCAAWPKDPPLEAKVPAKPPVK